MSYIIFFLAIAVTQSLLSQQEFTIEVRYGSQQTIQAWKQIGSLKIPKYSYDSPQIVLNYGEYLIDPSLMLNEPNAFASIKLSESKNQTKNWYTHVEQHQLKKIQAPYQENLQLVANLQNELSSFDYSLFQLRKQNLQEQTLVVKYAVSQNAPQDLPKPEIEKPKDGSPEEQPVQGIFGLVLQYKWWILVFFGVFFLASNLDPQKMNEAAESASSPQPQRRQQQRRP